jgi:hypothetical protein
MSAFEQHAEAGGVRLADAPRVAGVEQTSGPTTVAGSGSASIAPVLVAMAADGLMSRPGQAPAFQIILRELECHDHAAGLDLALHASAWCPVV